MTGKTQIKVKLDSFKWILFLGVIPFDKAALVLYQSSQVGSFLSYCLLLITVIIVCIGLVQNKSKRNKEVFFLANRIHVIFILIAILYIMNGLINDNLKPSRILSLFCLWAYYIFTLLEYSDPEELLKDISHAALFLIFLSLILYFQNNRNVYYQESATVFSFKGVALNRNGFVEFALFPVLYYWHNAINKNTKRKTKCLIVSLISIYSIVITKKSLFAWCC